MLMFRVVSHFAHHLSTGGDSDATEKVAVEIRIQSAGYNYTTFFVGCQIYFGYHIFGFRLHPQAEAWGFDGGVLNGF